MTACHMCGKPASHINGRIEGVRGLTWVCSKECAQAVMSLNELREDLELLADALTTKRETP